MGLCSLISRGPVGLSSSWGGKRQSREVLVWLVAVCRIGGCILHNLLSLLRVGWYVITRGISLVLGLCGWGCKDSVKPS